MNFDDFMNLIDKVDSGEYDLNNAADDIKYAVSSFVYNRFIPFCDQTANKAEHFVRNKSFHMREKKRLRKWKAAEKAYNEKNGNTKWS